MQLPHLFNGTTKEHYLLLFSVAGALALVAGLIGSWIGSYIGARRAVRTMEVRTSDPATTAQLSAMMNALDTMALEIERISEGQRFTAKVLSERVPSSLPRAEKKSITPH